MSLLFLMMAAGGFKVLGGTFASICVGTTSAPQVRFEPDGSVLRHQSDLSYATSYWGDPVTAGAGAGYWIKAELGAGTAAVGGDSTGVVLHLDIERTWSIAAASAGGVNTRSLTYEIYSDAAGTTVVGSGTLTLESDRS